MTLLAVICLDDLWITMTRLRMSLSQSMQAFRCFVDIDTDESISISRVCKFVR
jgi:hypothetical protein